MTHTYLRPTNADTGEPLLTVAFTAALCPLGDAHLYDLEARMADFAADVRDHLGALQLPIRPTIKQGRVRVTQESEPDENGYNKPTQVNSTMLAFLTDAEPDDPRLDELARGFHAERIDADVVFTIPTEESEAALVEEIAAENIRGAAYVAKASAEREEEVRMAADPFSRDMSDLFS